MPRVVHQPLLEVLQDVSTLATERSPRGTAHLQPVRELLCGSPPGSSTIHLGARGQGKGCVPGSSQDSYREALRVAEPIVSLRPDGPEPHAWTPCPRVHHFPPGSMTYTVSCHVSCLLYSVLLCPILYCCFTLSYYVVSLPRAPWKLLPIPSEAGRASAITAASYSCPTWTVGPDFLGDIRPPAVLWTVTCTGP